MLVDHARTMRFDDFSRVLTYWSQVADPGRRRTRCARAARATPRPSVGGAWAGDVLFDPIGGAIVDTTLQEIARELYDSDKASDSERTAAQRRADAFVEIATRAAPHHVTGGGRRRCSPCSSATRRSPDGCASCSAGPPGGRSRCVTATAVTTDVHGHQPSPGPTTSNRGRRAVVPCSATASSPAAATTASDTSRVPGPLGRRRTLTVVSTPSGTAASGGHGGARDRIRQRLPVT
jgi:hypothetical protein